MTKLIIEIKGGLLQSVYSNEPIEYILVDHDNIEAGDEFEKKHQEQDGLFLNEDMKLKEIFTI